MIVLDRITRMRKTNAGKEVVEERVRQDHQIMIEVSQRDEIRTKPVNIVASLHLGARVIRNVLLKERHAKAAKEKTILLESAVREILRLGKERPRPGKFESPESKELILQPAQF